MLYSSLWPRKKKKVAAKTSFCGSSRLHSLRWRSSGTRSKFHSPAVLCKRCSVPPSLRSPLIEASSRGVETTLDTRRDTSGTCKFRSMSKTFYFLMTKDLEIWIILALRRLNNDVAKTFTVDRPCKRKQNRTHLLFPVSWRFVELRTPTESSGSCSNK